MSQVIFSGPDLPHKVLSSSLANSIRMCKKGSSIQFLCYYLCNSLIIDALKEAADKHICVQLLIEKRPRTLSIGARSKLNTLTLCPNMIVTLASKYIWWNLLGIMWRPHLHEKIYYFSYPTPHAYVGSYNPSDDPENSILTNELIGDHSISHNVLVKIEQKEVVDFLRKHCIKMHSQIYRMFSRYLSDRDTTFLNGKYRVHFWPRLNNPFAKIIDKLSLGDELLAAISHLKGPGGISLFQKAKRRGVNVKLLLDSTSRRVPDKMLQKLEQLNIQYTQLNLPKYCLMHCKFLILRIGTQQIVAFGSFNWSTRSRWLNHEIAIVTSDRKIVDAFLDRWTTLYNEAQNGQ